MTHMHRSQWRPSWAVGLTVLGLAALLAPTLVCISILTSALRTPSHAFDYHGVILGVIGLFLVGAAAAPLGWFFARGGQIQFWVGLTLSAAWNAGLLSLLVIGIMRQFS